MNRTTRRVALALLLCATAAGSTPGLAADDGPSEVRALIYSRTAAELFWNQEPGSGRVEIRRNGRVVGLFDARSHFREGLDPTRDYVWELRLVDSDGTRSAPVRLSFSTGEHTGSIREVVATRPGSEAAALPASVDAGAGVTARASTASPVSAPAPVPMDDEPQAPSGPGDVAARRQVSIAPDDCVVDSVAALIDCARGATGYTRLNIRRDLVCEGTACCPGGGALVTLRGVDGLDIAGNGYRLLRRGGHRRCSLVDVASARDLHVTDWTLDDDGTVAPCVVGDGCPRMVHVRDSRNVVFERLEVAHSKGYAIYVDGVDGFAFRDSTLRDSGVLGLYVGHEARGSSRVRIERSTFRDNQTNGLALLGVTGDGPATNRVSENLFERNHWRGQWPVEPQYGTGTTGGGQLYVARASGVTIEANVLRDGRCENCFDQGVLGSGVSGIELGLPRQRSLSDIVVRDNDIVDHDAWGVFSNVGSPMDTRVVVVGNRLSGNGRALAVPGAEVGGNLTGGR